jgi:hypothetical protein
METGYSVSYGHVGFVRIVAAVSMIVLTLMFVGTMDLVGKSVQKSEQQSARSSGESSEKQKPWEMDWSVQNTPTGPSENNSTQGLKPFYGVLDGEAKDNQQANVAVQPDHDSKDLTQHYKGWTQESTRSTEIGPWLNYDPPGTRYCRYADGTIIRVYPPGIRPDAEPANSFCADVSTATPR